MKSDWEDAPDHIRYKKKESPWQMVAILGVGSVITLGLIALLAKPMVIDLNQLSRASLLAVSRSSPSREPKRIARLCTPLKRCRHLSNLRHKWRERRLAKRILSGLKNKLSLL